MTLDDNKIITSHIEGINSMIGVVNATNKAKLLSSMEFCLEAIYIRTVAAIIFFLLFAIAAVVAVFDIPTNIAYYYVQRWLNFGFYFAMFVHTQTHSEWDVRVCPTWPNVNCSCVCSRRNCVYFAINFRSMRSTQTHTNKAIGN